MQLVMASLKLFTTMVMLMLMLSLWNPVFPSISCLGLVNTSFPPPLSPSSTSLSPRKDDIGRFVARLIHRSSPESPFYNPRASLEDLMIEDIRTSQQRSLYFSQQTRGERSMKMIKAPISNHYVMRFGIGTPPLQTFAIPDTASSLSWMQCYPCKKCYKQMQGAPIYNRQKSSSFREVFCANFNCYSHNYLTCLEGGVCGYKMTYLDNSSTVGYIASETFTFEATDFGGSTTIEDINFGCGTNNTDTTKIGFPGIIGLGYHDVSLVRQMRYHRFSYCVMQDRNGDVQGWIHFGFAAMLSGRSTPLMPNTRDNLYYLSIEGISVGDEKLNLPKKIFDNGFIIDSGSSHSLLFIDAYNALIEKVKSIMYDEEVFQIPGYDLCYEDISDVPDIQFDFKDLSFRLREVNTWTYTSSQFYCLEIFKSTEVSIFGMHQQRGVNVGYDLTQQKLTLQYVSYCPEDDED